MLIVKWFSFPTGFKHIVKLLTDKTNYVYYETKSLIHGTSIQVYFTVIKIKKSSSWSFVSLVNKAGITLYRPSNDITTLTLRSMLSSSRFSNSDSMLGSLGSKFTCFLLGCRGTWLSFISILPWTWASSSLYNNKRDELGSYSQTLWYEHIISWYLIDDCSGTDIIEKQLLCP